jgi:ubiquinone/menaquinone biosynthesis C-methylase UbiE
MQAIIGLLILSIGCSHHGENLSNQHMHKKDHQELIAAFDDPKRDSWQKPQVVMERLRPLEGLKVIDIGAGSGYFTKYFLREKSRVVAADVDEKFLHHIQKSVTNPHLNLRKIKYHDPMMEAEEFDLAFTSNTYHHIDGRSSYLKKVLNGLKSGGRFVVLDFKAEVKDSFGPPQKMRIPLVVVKKELLQAGFRDLVEYEDFEHSYLVIAYK